MAKPKATVFAPYIVARKRKKGVVYQAALRRAKDERRSVGTYDTREIALAACQAMLSDGVPVPSNRRGPKKGCKRAGGTVAKPRVAKRAPAPVVKSTDCDRIAMMKRVWGRAA